MNRRCTRSRPARGFLLPGPTSRIAAIGAGILLSLWAAADAPKRAADPAAVIPVRGVISDVLRDSIDRRMQAALADGARTLIFEIDTPGGLVTSALDICRIIKNVPPDVHTVAWVNPHAFSAGAMIAVSCKQILMAPRSSIGDCAPIMATPVGGLEELPPAERAKIESPVLQEFRDSAIRNGYDPLLLRAMVTVGEEVWWLENSQTGERRFVNAAQKRALLGTAEFSFAEEQPGPWRLVETYVHSQTGREVPAKQPVDSAEELLTLTQDEAVAYGLATAIVPDLSSVAAVLGLALAPRYLDITAWEQFVMWLNRPEVRGFLFIIVLIGAYIEFQNPGLMLPGLAAGVALVIFLAAPYAAGLADIWTFALLAIGLILLGVEIFVIPGFGITGFLGLVLILIAVIGTFVPAEPSPDPARTPFFNWPSLPATWQALRYGLIVMSSSVIVAMMGILLLIRYLPQLSVGRRLIPVNPIGQEMTMPASHPDVALVGDIGIVTGALRPGGQARFGQEIVDVHSQGEYVDAGRRVQVLRREGMSILVRPLPEEPPA